MSDRLGIGLIVVGARLLVLALIVGGLASASDAIAGSAAGPRGKLVIARNGKALATIVVAKDAPEKVRVSAAFLQETLQQMSGACLPIASDDQVVNGARILVGQSRYSDNKGIRVPQAYYPAKDRFVIKRSGDCIALLGNDAQKYNGTRRAVYVFLEKLGCGWYTPDPNWTVVPKLNIIAVGDMNIDVVPALYSRVAGWWDKPEGIAWGLGGVPLNINHSYYQMFPAGEFEVHPEYFAMVNGKRMRESSQICYSNPDVIARVVKLARENFDKDPAQVMFSVSANDCGGFCECSECAKMGATPAERNLAFANIIATEVRKTHPDKYIVFYSYWYTAAAPNNMKAAPGVNVMIVNNSCKVHGLNNDACAYKKAWKENFLKWKATGASVSVYEWYIPAATDGTWAQIPWLPGNAALNDLRYYRANGCMWMFYESLSGEVKGTEPIRWPLYYVASRGMENPDCSVRQILEPECRKLFGMGWKPMLDFYMELSNAAQKCRTHGGNWNLPDPASVYTPGDRAKLNGLLDDAASLAADQARALRRINDVTDCWRKAEAVVVSTKPRTLYEVCTNCSIWYTDLQSVTTQYLRDLIGINQDAPVLLTERGGARRALREDEELKLETGRPVTLVQF